MSPLSQYALQAGEKLRLHGLVAARLIAFFHPNKHKPDRPKFGGSRRAPTIDCESASSLRR